MNLPGKNICYVMVGLLLLTLYQAFVLYPVGSGLHRVIDNGDAFLHSWNLWWAKTSVFDGFQTPYYTTYNGYPEGLPLTFHQFILPYGIVSVPLFLIGFESAQVLLFWQYVMAFVGFSGMYFLVIRFKGNKLGALVSGLYFVILPIYWQNFPRPDSLSYVLFPWIVISVYWLEDGEWKRLCLPVLLSSLVLLVSPYFGAGLGLLWLVTLIFSGRLNLSSWKLGSLASLTLLVTSFHWVRQVLHEHPNLPSNRIVEAYSADVTAWFLPPHQLWWIPKSGAWWVGEWLATEPSLYVGWFALGTVIIGIYTQWNAKVRWGSGVSLLFVIIAIGPGIKLLGETYLSGFMPYAWGLELFSFLRAFRAPMRFGFFALFFCALGLGLVFPEEGKLRWLLAIAILIELVRFPVKTVRLPSESKMKKISRTVDEPALIPVPLTSWPTEVQYAQTIHEKKMPLIGISYAPEKVWSTIGGNPVLQSLYKRNELPEVGWKSLKEEGYGGLVFHRKLFDGKLKQRKEKWINFMRKKFGPPEIRTERISFFKF